MHLASYITLRFVDLTYRLQYSKTSSENLNAQQKTEKVMWTSLTPLDISLVHEPAHNVNNEKKTSSPGRTL
jgi:hypothetical protein